RCASMARARPTRRRTSRGFLLLVALTLAGACSNTVDSHARLMDDACSNSACTTTGNARQTTGVTDDSIGFHLGRGGKLSIPIPTYTSSNSYIDVQVLVSGHGKFTGRLIRNNCGDGGSCTPTTVDTASVYVSPDYGWASVGTSSTSTNQFAGLSAEVE